MSDRHTVRRALVMAGVGGVAAAGLIGPGAASAEAAESCSDVEVVFARGTAEPAGLGRVGQAFVNELQNDLGGRTVSVYAVNYPASYDFLQSAPLGAADASASHPGHRRLLPRHQHRARRLLPGRGRRRPHHRGPGRDIRIRSADAAGRGRSRRRRRGPR